MVALPSRIRKEIMIGPRRVRVPRKRKKTPLQIIFNNSRSSIKPGSAPDPNFVLQSQFKPYIRYTYVLPVPIDPSYRKDQLLKRVPKTLVKIKRETREALPGVYSTKREDYIGLSRKLVDRNAIFIHIQREHLGIFTSRDRTNILIFPYFFFYRFFKLYIDESNIE